MILSFKYFQRWRNKEKKTIKDSRNRVTERSKVYSKHLACLSSFLIHLLFDTATLYVVIEGKTIVRNGWQNLNDRVFLTVCFNGFKNDQHLEDVHIERIEWWFPIEKNLYTLKTHTLKECFHNEKKKVHLWRRKMRSLTFSHVYKKSRKGIRTVNWL